MPWLQAHAAGRLDPMTETQLVRAAAARDPRAVATLYRTHFAPLQRRALAITGCPQDAADAAQDALLATFARLPELDPDTLSFGAYATTVTRHEALKLRRTIAEPTDRATAEDPTRPPRAGRAASAASASPSRASRSASAGSSSAMTSSRPSARTSPPSSA